MNSKFFIKIVTILITIFLVCFIIYAVKLGLLEDKEILVSYINSLGFGASFFFLFLQAFQVVFPIIPGGASCLAGVLAFGPVFGFIYNYLGLSIGSIISYSLSLKYGEKIIYKLFDKALVDKYLGYIRNNTFKKIFFLGILIPGAPDDLLCYIAGVSSIKMKEFIICILLGKPLTLLFYSIFYYLL